MDDLSSVFFCHVDKMIFFWLNNKSIDQKIFFVNNYFSVKFMLKLLDKNSALLIRISRL